MDSETGGFSGYLWKYLDGKPKQNEWATLKQVPAETPVSQAISKDLRKRGFTFVGPTIVYAFMQAVGMVNDHTVDRSEEHTSELQSLMRISYAVFCLKKKNTTNNAKTQSDIITQYIYPIIQHKIQ